MTTDKDTAETSAEHNDRDLSLLTSSRTYRRHELFLTS